MNKPRIRVLAVVIGFLAAALVGAPSTSAALSANSAAPGDQRFLLLESGTDEDGVRTVLGFGTIHAKGKWVTINDFKDRFKFADGNVVIKHNPDESTQQETYDPDTCYFQFSERGTWKVVKGTGAYVDAVGSGTYRVRAYGVGCSEDGPDELFTFRAVARGTLTY